MIRMRFIIIILVAGCSNPNLSVVEEASKSSKFSITEGEYDCRILSETWITALHLEGAGNPISGSSNEPGNYFGIRIDKNHFGEDRAQEIPTDKRPINQQDLEFGVFPSVLMVPYIHNGFEFRAPERADFMQFYGSDQDFHFWQSGYQYPGGSDTELVSRYGDCEPR